MNNLALAIGWTLILLVSIITAFFTITLTADYIGRYLACNAFAYKAHWHKPDDSFWQRTQRTARLA